MNKKIFFIVLMVALAATMSVELTSCNEDVKEPEDLSHLIMDNWYCIVEQCKGNRIKFDANSEYSYSNPELGNGSGTYRILASFKDKEVRLGDRNGNPMKATLFIIEVSPNDVFDLIYVYHFITPALIPGIAVDYYSNNVLLTDYLWALYSQL